jgi:hypothetical protein
MTRQLLEATTRQAAWEQLVNQAHEDSFEDADVRDWLLHATVSHVVACPQPQGDPMYAVFLDGPAEKPEGGFVLVHADGKRILTAPCQGNNSLKPYDLIADINGDGIVEIVSTALVSTGKETTTRELTVFGATPSQEPLFTLFFDWHRETHSLLRLLFFKDNYEDVEASLNEKGVARPLVRPRHLAKETWFWRVTGAAARDYRIEVGPIERDRFEAKASFQWSARERRFTGPKGRVADKFLSFAGAVSDADWDDFVQQVK